MRSAVLAWSTLITLAACGEGNAPAGPPEGKATQLVFSTQPTNAIAGTPINPAVKVSALDASSKVVTSFVGVVRISIATNSGTDTLKGTTTVAADNGVATFSSVYLTRAATGYTLTATTDGPAAARSAAFDVAPGAATRLAFTVEPSTSIPGGPISPPVQVAVQDAFGNIVTAFAGDVTVAIGTNPSAGTLTGTLTVAPASGVAVFSTLSIDKPGIGYTLKAAATNVTATTTSAEFIVMALDQRFTSLSAGGDHTCAIKTTGAAFCWGSNGAAQLGAGMDLRCLVGSYMEYCSTRPVEVLGSLQFQAITAGFLHTCGVTIGGAAYCWGLNWHGALGIGDTTPEWSAEPNAVTGGLSFITLSAGGDHICGVAQDQQVYCWGYNRSGQLGDSSWVDRWAPVPVAGPLAASMVSAADANTCAVTSGGAGFCWGDNSWGQLGVVTDPNNTPQPVVGGQLYGVISAGYDHSCGLTTQGQVYCWGANSSGQLGIGAPSYGSGPAAVTGGMMFIEIGAGATHTCGLVASGKVYCWGSNHNGQLGTGDTTSSATPVAVVDGHQFRTLSVGWDHTCALTPDGIAYCWGGNWRGQLGNGGTEDALRPTPVSP